MVFSVEVCTGARGSHDVGVGKPDEQRVVLITLGGGFVPHLALALEEAGQRVERVTNIAEARRVLTLQGPRVGVIVDAALLPATINGALSALRQQDAVVVCTPRCASTQRIALLAEGADHVLSTRDPLEVVAVLAAVFRRTATVPFEPVVDVLCAGDISVHLSARVATAGGQTLRLTRLEFDLLTYFVARAGVLLSRERLLSEVWGYDVGGLETVTVHIRRLRTKIEREPSRPVRLQTVWGLGYRLSPDPPN